VIDHVSHQYKTTGKITHLTALHSANVASMLALPTVGASLNITKFPTRHFRKHELFSKLGKFKLHVQKCQNICYFSSCLVVLTLSKRFWVQLMQS
jgi:hypothetical protein